MTRIKFDNPDVALIDKVWKHYAIGAPLPVGDHQITRKQFDMVLNKLEPISDALEWNGYTRDQAWDYLADVAPWAVDLVGVPPA